MAKFLNKNVPEPVETTYTFEFTQRELDLLGIITTNAGRSNDSNPIVYGEYSLKEQASEDYLALSEVFTDAGYDRFGRVIWEFR